MSSVATGSGPPIVHRYRRTIQVGHHRVVRYRSHHAGGAVQRVQLIAIDGVAIVFVTGDGKSRMMRASALGRAPRSSVGALDLVGFADFGDGRRGRREAGDLVEFIP
jgi:hypothetical protein